MPIISDFVPLGALMFLCMLLAAGLICDADAVCSSDVMQHVNTPRLTPCIINRIMRMPGVCLEECMMPMCVVFRNVYMGHEGFGFGGLLS